MLLEKIEQAKSTLREEIKELLAHENKESAEESRERGKNLRKKVPRTSHATWEPSLYRLNPMDLIKSQETTRVSELLPIRHERMAASPFAFFRGSAILMASDLATTPSTGLNVQACGDAHISNFGFFQSPERHLVFDINDFDETARGPWEWDTKRLATSVEICGRNRGFSEKERSKAVRAAVESYQTSMLEFSQMKTMDVWYAHTDVEDFYSQFSGSLSKNTQKNTEKIILKAKTKNSDRAVLKLTEVVDGKVRFINQPPLIIPLRNLVEQQIRREIPDTNLKEREHLIALVLRKYQESLSNDKRHLMKQYHGVDIARKVVGVGSVGTRCWIVLLEGLDSNDPLVLQIKEAQESVLERFTGKSIYKNNGQRVVEGQRAIQAASDVLLGWTRAVGVDGVARDYYVRQLWDGKGSINLDTISSKQLTNLAKTCGKTLARSHARTGNRFAIAGYLGKSDAFSKAIVQFSQAYADQNETDYQLFMKEYQANSAS